MSNALIIDDFTQLPDSTIGGRWSYTSDRVMGGVSNGGGGYDEVDGRMAIRLFGQVSTANNGGFIQVSLRLDPRLMRASRRADYATRVDFEVRQKIEALTKRRAELVEAIAVLKRTYATLRAQSPRAQHRMQRMSNLDHLDVAHVSKKLVETERLLKQFDHKWGFRHTRRVSFRRAWRAHPNSAANGEREESACGRADRYDARDAAVHPAPQLPPREHASAGGDA